MLRKDWLLWEIVKRLQDLFLSMVMLEGEYTAEPLVKVLPKKANAKA